ncbi:hypothetical protein B0H17DRAFT_1144285 [Mycena rosella]|uniref:Uncharacterized protein n=1 Tax=Mycena rosella TaxID=1033263 RepID=A0AAD7G334_MYCRO|nr:hypothetical protein B0H17DRAFT_1144285 [Mycena rosella]
MRRTAQDPLPIELWDLVVLKLDVQPVFILILATLCIAHYLLSAEVSAEFLATGTIDIDGHHLPALQLPCCAPPLKRLSCTGFAISAVLPSLKLVQEIVEISPELWDLTLGFSHHLFKGSSTDTTTSPEVLLAVLCSVMYTMSSKMAGPVVVIYPAVEAPRCGGNLDHWQGAELVHA